MNRWRRGSSRASVSEDHALAAVWRGMDDVLAALNSVVDDEAVLARVCASAGRDTPTSRPVADIGTAAQEACRRIGMLESAIAVAVRGRSRSPFLGTLNLRVTQRYMLELRTGLENRTTTRQDAYRLLNSSQHALRESEKVLRRQHALRLAPQARVQVEDLLQLSTDLICQLDDLTDEVMKLFDHQGDSVPILVPQR